MLKGTILEYESCIPAQSKMAMNTTNKPTHVAVYMCAGLYMVTRPNILHI